MDPPHPEVDDLHALEVRDAVGRPKPQQVAYGLHPEPVVAEEDVADPGDQHRAGRHASPSGVSSSGWK
ncbi:hypothetical protein ACWEV4_15880 [Streptomyces sp. NPDC003860]